MTGQKGLILSKIWVYSAIPLYLKAQCVIHHFLRKTLPFTFMHEIYPTLSMKSWLVNLTGFMEKTVKVESHRNHIFLKI